MVTVARPDPRPRTPKAGLLYNAAVQRVHAAMRRVEQEEMLAIQPDIPANLHPAARRNVLAHLIDLYEKNQVTAPDRIHPATAFQRI